MRRIGPLLMSTVLVTGCASAALNNESLRTILEKSGQSQAKLSPYEQGKRHLQFGSAGLAVDAFQTALRDAPDSVAILNGLAVAYDRLGRGDVAQQFLDRALSVDPNSPVTLNNLAYLNLVQGNTAVALAYAERAKIAAALPMDMMLPDTIANAVDRNAEIASQVAASEKQERPVAQAPVLPRESDIKRVGLNEWELRIRPPNPADAVRINFPARGVTPRVIAPMAQQLAPSVVTGPLTGVVVVSPEIPDSVMADLAIAPAEAAPTTDVAAEVSSLAAPSAASLPAYEAPAADAIALLPPMIATVPQQQLPEPARIEPMVASLPSYRPPAAGAIAALSPTLPAIPEQPMPDAVPVEPMVTVLPYYAPPAIGSIAALSPALPAMPRQQLPEPALVESMVAVLPSYAPPAMGAIAAPSPVLPAMPQQQLPEPALVEPMVAVLPSYAPPTAGAIAAVTSAITAVPPQRLPEPARVEVLSSLLPVPEIPHEPVREPAFIASLAVPAPAPRTILLPPTVPERRDDPASPTDTLPATAAPEAAAQRPVTPMIASVAPPRADTAGVVETTGLKSGWRASLPSSTMVRVSNGTGRRLMASRFARYFGEHGLTVRKIANANSFDYRWTVIFYNPDQRAQAEALAAVLPFSVRLVEAKQGRGQIELVLGLDLLSVDNLLRSA